MKVLEVEFKVKSRNINGIKRAFFLHLYQPYIAKNDE